MLLTIIIACIAYFIHVNNLVTISVTVNQRHPFLSSNGLFSRWPFSKSSASDATAAYPDDLIALTSELINIPSVTGQEEAVFAYVIKWLRVHKFRVEVQDLTPTATRKRQNILAYGKNVESKSDLRVILSTHLDTVPPSRSAQNATAWHDTARGRLYGRGSVDAKGQAAAMILTLMQMNSPRVGLLLVSGEERDHVGMSHAHEFKLSEDITLVNGEPTESKLVVKQKGMIRATLKVFGTAAHSGYPYLGVNANHHMLQLLGSLLDHTSDHGRGGRSRRGMSDEKNTNDDAELIATYNGTTMNVGGMKGGDGSAPNVVPHYAEAVLVWRIPGDAAGKLDLIERIVNEYRLANAVNASVTFDKFNDAVQLHAPEHLASEVGRATVAYNTDIPYYRRRTRNCVLFGAGSIHQAHTDDEYIDTAKLEQLPVLYERLVRELLQQDYKHDDIITIKDEV